MTSSRFSLIVLPLLLARAILQRDWRYRINPKDWENKEEKIFILGNGPSIKQQLEEYASELGRYDCFCVNHFADSDYFLQVKPKFYLIVDPYFFADDVHSDLREKRETTYSRLSSMVSWKMTLFVPGKDAERIVAKHLNGNSHIKICPFNSRGVGRRFEKFAFPLYRLNFAAIVGHNVLSSAIYISLILSYKKIFILGADYSWLESIEVDRETNLLYSQAKHFYGEKRDPWYSNYRKDEINTMDQVLYLLSLSFKSHRLLNQFSEYLEAEILNASSHSWIDAYNRISLKTVLAVNLS